MKYFLPDYGESFHIIKSLSDNEVMTRCGIVFQRIRGFIISRKEVFPTTPCKKCYNNELDTTL